MGNFGYRYGIVWYGLYRAFECKGSVEFDEHAGRPCPGNALCQSQSLSTFGLQKNRRMEDAETTVPVIIIRRAHSTTPFQFVSIF